MGNSNYAFTKRNEFGDTFRYKSGSGRKQMWVGTRVCLGQREERTFKGESRDALEAWAEWCHSCDRDAPSEEPTPMVPAAYRVKEKDMPKGHRLSDETRSEIEELLEAGDMTQQEIADAYEISTKTVSSINVALREKRQRAEERQRAREEERRLREEESERRMAEVEASKPEPLPENFLPRPKPAEDEPQRYYVIAESGMRVMLFPSRERAEKALRLVTAFGCAGNNLEVIECSFWEED